MAKNYYIILGVATDATPKEIKSAYRQHVKELHPDYHGKDSEPFLSLQEAYSVLIDPVQRRAYDEGLRAEERHQRMRKASAEPFSQQAGHIEPLVPERPSGRFEEISLERSFQSYRPSFEEIFDRLWSNFSGMAQPKAERLKSLDIEIPITPVQAFQGGCACVHVPVRTECPTCSGYGGVGPFQCRRCDGSGIVQGEQTVLVSFPAGIPDNYTAQVLLERFGIHNFYLNVHFRVTENI